MKQFDVNDAMKIPIDSNDNDIPESAKILQPLIFLEETNEAKAYCVVLGPDPQAGVCGCGNSPKEALWDWDNQLKEFIENHETGDQVAAYIDEMYGKESMPFETPNAKGLS
jgi:hypothetical protein